MSKHDIPPEAHVTLQYQYRKCGKRSCICYRSGQPHGPYWYGYWRDKATGKLHSCYFGKDDPRGDVATTAKALGKQGKA